MHIREHALPVHVDSAYQFMWIDDAHTLSTHYLLWSASCARSRSRAHIPAATEPKKCNIKAFFSKTYACAFLLLGLPEHKNLAPTLPKCSKAHEWRREGPALPLLDPALDARGRYTRVQVAGRSARDPMRACVCKRSRAFVARQSHWPLLLYA